jgi:hypothetical protein
MMKKDFSPAVKIFIFLCLALLLAVFSACTKSTTEQAATETPSARSHA